MRHSKRWAFIRWAVLLLGACLSASALAQERVVRVGVYDNAPKILLGKGGQPGGILGELLGAIAQEEGWTLKTVACVWQDCLDALQSANIDLLPDVAFSESREHLYDFHQTPALHSWSQVYERRGGSIKSMQDLAGKRIAALAGSAQHDYLAMLTADFGVHPALLAADTLEEGFDMAANGVADAAIANYFFGEWHAAKYGLIAAPVMFQPTRLFYAASKGRNGDLLMAIDQRLEQWQKTPGSPYYRVLQRWGASQSPAMAPPPFWWALAALACLLMLAMGIAVLLKAQVARQTRHLQASEAKLNTILDSVDALIYIKDCNLRYLYGNRRVCELFGKSPGELIGCTDDDFFDKGTRARVRKDDLRVIENGERVVCEEHNITVNGKTTDTILSIKIPLRNPQGKVEALCGISTDITEHRAAQQTAHRLAFYDPLTELPNRRLLLERINHVLDSADHASNLGALLFIDLDHFKRINDARGHDVGDAVLCSVAQRLQDITHSEDTVARIGGDEFVILLDDVGRTEEEGVRQAMLTAEKVRAALEQPIVIKRQDYLAGGSIGVTLLTPGSKSTADVLREADTAMYRSKESGRNRVAFYEASMHTEVDDRLALEHDLTQAIGTPQLEMQIQAQWNSARRVVGAELLIRWNHPERGAISPEAFIPIAEETGVILRLGDWALQQACKVLAQLKLAGQPYPLSINVSPRQFRQADFVKRVREILQESGAPAGQLIFEVTEGVLIDDLQGSINRMTELSTLGVRFSIDDFGTGYCSLAYLKRLPLYELKIDECFIRDTPGSTDDVAIVKLILAMARQLNLKVVAEGVETQEQADFLIENGCDAIQGYLFARPMTVAEWLGRAAAA